MNVRPTMDRLIVLPAPQKEVTKSGIVLPGSAQENQVRGTVVAVGNGIYENGELVPSEIVVGDVVIYAPYVGVEFEHEGEDYRVLRPEDVIAIEVEDA